LTNCFTTGVSYCVPHRANSEQFGDSEVEENGTVKGKGRLRI